MFDVTLVLKDIRACPTGLLDWVQYVLHINIYLLCKEKTDVIERKDSIYEVDTHFTLTKCRSHFTYPCKGTFSTSRFRLLLECFPFPRRRSVFAKGI